MRRNTGFAIALAWPDTYCKQVGAWYDPLMNWLGFARNNYYKVGHAAVILIDSLRERCYYFDFGRYHTPFQYGRVRGMDTDPELELTTKPLISVDGQRLENFDAVLTEIQSKVVYHGEGDVYAAYTKIGFNAAFAKAVVMQEQGAIAYGPFTIGGTNCSRFVNKVIRTGQPKFLHWLKLNCFLPLTPTPLLNVKNLSEYTVKKKQYDEERFVPKSLSKEKLRSTLIEPQRHKSIPDKAQWLAGEGAGSWFVLEWIDSLLKVERYSKRGELEGMGYFECEEHSFLKFTNKMEIVYLSNFQEVKLMSDNETYSFIRISDWNVKVKAVHEYAVS